MKRCFERIGKCLVFVCRFDDGMVEVFALYSSFHIAQLQVGLAEPLRLGQAKTVKVVNRYMQLTKGFITTLIKLHF